MLILKRVTTKRKDSEITTTNLMDLLWSNQGWKLVLIILSVPKSDGVITDHLAPTLVDCWPNSDDWASNAALSRWSEFHWGSGYPATPICWATDLSHLLEHQLAVFGDSCELANCSLPTFWCYSETLFQGLWFFVNIWTYHGIFTGR
jgi:hypothetical protein